MHAMGEVAPVRRWSSRVRRDLTIRRAARSVAWALADDETFGTTGCRATDDEIAAEIGITGKTVRNALAMLMAAGHIECVRRRGRGGEVRTIHPAIAVEPPTAASTDLADVVLSEPVSLSVDRAEPEESVQPAVPAVVGLPLPEELDPAPEATPLVAESVLADAAPSVDEVDISPADLVVYVELPPPEEPRRKDEGPPGSQWSPKRQIAQAEKRIRDLPWRGRWCCHDASCQAEASFICADKGRLSCRIDRGTLDAPVALARFGLGPLSPTPGPGGYGDFQERLAG